MMNLASNSKVTTNTSPATIPATMICTGFNCTVSASWSPRLRTPKNADNTVFTTASGVAFLGFPCTCA